MKAREIFFKVKRHLLKQGLKADNYKGECCYKDPIGLMCSVGCLLPDGHQGLGYMGPVDDLIEEHPDLAGILLAEDLEAPIALTLLKSLQEIHDNKEPDLWAASLDKFWTKFTKKDVFLGER